VEAILDDRQLPLFRRLPIPKGAEPRRRRSPIHRAFQAVAQWVQLELRMVLVSLRPEDDDDDWDYPERRIVSAATAGPAPETRAAPSIFAMAASIAADRAMRRPAASDFAPSAPGALPVIQVHRLDGVTRVAGAMYPAGRWTEEKAEAERARRARQRPPKPTKAAKTRGRKVREWDGEPFDA